MMSQASHAQKSQSQKSSSYVSSPAAKLVTDQNDQPEISSENFPLLEAISRAAYLRAEARHFEPGHELEDWLEAEQEISGAEATASV